MATSSIHLAFVGVILMILCTNPVTNGEVPDGVVYTDLHKTVQKGAEVVLKCQFYGAPVAVYWKKGNNPTTSSNLITRVEGESPSGSCVRDGACEIGDDYSLTIKEAKIGDQGRYICRVSNYMGILIHNFTDIVIFAPPNEPYPVINECQEMALFNPNDFCKITSHIPIEITCSVTNYFPDVDLFFLRSFQNVAASRTNELVNDDGTKNKSVVIEADSGEWTCVCVALDIPGTLENRTAKIVVLNVENDLMMTSYTTVSSEKKKDAHIAEIAASYTTVSSEKNKEARIAEIAASYTTVSSEKNKEARIAEIAAPASLFILLVAVVVFLVAIHRREKLACKCDIEKGDVASPTMIEGKISFYELWFLIFGNEDDDRLGKIHDTLLNLGISDVGDGLNAAQCYDVFCNWKDHHTQDNQATDLRRALAKAGFDSAWKAIYDERHRTDEQLSEDTLKHILWQVGDPDRINKFLGDLIPGKRIGVAGKVKEIITRALGELIQWCKVPAQKNPKVLLSLSLERASCHPVDRDFFIVPECLLEEIGENEVLGFTQRITGKHCIKLAESFNTSKEALGAFLVENDKAPLFDTQRMILDWISKEDCSNLEKRHRLNIAVTQACREDLKGHFGATHLYHSEETNKERAEKDSNEISREYGGISELEIRRIANFLSDSELKHLGEGSDPVTVVLEWVKSLTEEVPVGGFRKRVHGTLKEIGFQALMPSPLKDRVCLVELLDVAVRLLMTDIQPLAKALGISEQKLFKYKIDVSPKQLSNGTYTLLAKNSNKINNDRSQICSALSKAGYNDLELLLKYGYAISLADMFALGYGPVPNSSQRAKLRQNLGIAMDHDDIVSMLKHWKSLVHPPSFIPRTALADAVLPVLGKEKALAVLSGNFRQNGIQSENVIRALRDGILFRESCRVAEILSVPLLSEADDLMTQVLITLEDQVKNGSLAEDVYEKLSLAGFKGLSTELKKGDRQENDSEITQMQIRDIIQNDISSRIADVLGVKRTSSLSTIFEAWEEKIRKNPLKQEKRRELSDRLLRAGYEDFAHEIMTGFVPRPLDKK